MTNIGISHIEQLKTQENIRSEKLHIIDCFPEDGVLYLNVDDPMLEELMGRLPVRTIGYGIDNPCDYRAEKIRCDGESTRFHLTYPGRGGGDPNSRHWGTPCGAMRWPPSR